MSRVAKEFPDFPVHTPSDNFERKDIDGVRNLPVDIYDRDLAMEMLDHIEECYAEIDRLRANALEWVTVTDDRKTWPPFNKSVLVHRLHSGPGYVSLMLRPYADIWNPVENYGDRHTITPGDRWAYIP